jgi:CheY-like chemotaxis protein
MAPQAAVLAVDDNNSNLKIVKLFLKRAGIVPDLCDRGTKAIELCKTKKYDLILLDHMMPQPDGIEVLHTIKKDADSLNKNTKVVVLTANAVAGSRQMYIDEGFDDYLTKPLDSKVLEQTVMDMLPKEKLHLAEDEKTGFSAEKASSIKSRLTAIEGLDYETALGYCGGDEEFLKEIISDVAAEGHKRSERMRKNLEDRDFKAYQIEAHSVKSTMATIGLKSLSERAKQHEFAAKDSDTEFILKDADDFISEYVSVCEQLDFKEL